MLRQSESSGIGQWFLRQAVLAPSILAMAVVGFLIWMMFFKVSPKDEEQSEALPRVTLAQVVPHTSGVHIDVDGLVIPYREVDLPTEVGGRVIEKSELCRTGSYVERGTLLIRIDKRDFELEVRRLSKELEQADAALLELDEQKEGTEKLLQLAEEQVALRQRELKRQKDLGEVITVSELERAQANELTARNSRQSLANQVRLFEVSRSRLESAKKFVEVQLEKAELDLSRTDILAPISGVVVEEHVEADGYVQKGATLLTIEDTSKAEIRCRLGMDDLKWLWDADPSRAAGRPFQIPQVEDVQVTFHPAGWEQVQSTWTGRLDRYDGIGVDQKTRTVPSIIVVDDPIQTVSPGPQALVRGMFVSARIHVNPLTRLLRVPARAVRPGNVIWKVDSHGTLTIVSVHVVDAPSGNSDATASDTLEQRIVYLNDADQLLEGDSVVTSPLSYVKSHMKVKPASQPEREAKQPTAMEDQ